MEEDLEARAFEALKATWPSPRHYLFYNLREHPHEDIPIRWFQLFVDVDEPTTVELILEELRAHGEDPRYQEDLAALMEVLLKSRDPELEDKILGAINGSSASPAEVALLNNFLEAHRPADAATPSAWIERAKLLELNRQYIDAATLFERGDRTQATMALDAILASHPGYPLAVNLKDVIKKKRPETD